MEWAFIRHRVGTVSFPAGRYAAEFSDAEGTYYAAPTKIVSDVLGTQLMDGGFFVPFGNPALIRPYLVSDEENDHAPFKLIGPATGLAHHFEH